MRPAHDPVSSRMKKARAPLALYGAALLAFASGGVVCGVYAVEAVREVGALAENPVYEVPGQYFVEAKEPGRYDVFHVLDERDPPSEEAQQKLRVRLRPDEGGARALDALPSPDTDAWTYEVNGRVMKPLFTFEVVASGRYLLDVEGRAPGVHARVLFGHDLEGALSRSFSQLLWAVLGGIGAFALGMPLFLIGLTVHLRRRRRA